MAEDLKFVANLPPIQSALTMSGDGQRCLIKLEAFAVNAALANIGLQQFSNRSFLVTIEEIKPQTLTDFDDETTESTEGSSSKVDRGRSTKRRDQRKSGTV